MTNPSGALRLLITYAVCIPVAITVGYLLTNPLDYGTLGFFALLFGILISPVFIKWHYPLLVFGLACPMICFFVVGKPPLAQVVAVMSLGIAITEGIMNSEKRFLKVPAMTWPLLFIGAMAYMTAELNGGIGLHALGGDTGGGRKYLDVFTGVATYFALTSRAIPRQRFHFYLMLAMLPSLLGALADLFPYLPSPLNKINLLFPPTSTYEDGVSIGTTRLTSFSFAIGTIMAYMLARYGLRGIFSFQKPGRALLFTASFLLSMLGGYRSSLIGMSMTLILMFFLERMYRTRLMPFLVMGGILGVTLLVSFSDKLPYTFQRSMSFLPLNWDPAVVLDADGSAEWRYAIWRATWPQVPDHLLLGKGYTITKEDYELIANGQLANAEARFNAGDNPLAISGDYHSGPLSTLMPFGLWGGIGMLWLMGATIYVTYRNYKYGDPELHTYNIYMFVSAVTGTIFFLFIFGGFSGDVGSFARLAGLNIAFNGGLARRPAKAAYNPPIKPLTARAPQPA
jgi:hypothetical protein